MIKYLNYTISWQEIPDEVSLSFNLTQCPGTCEECHSPELRSDIGYELTVNMLDDIMSKYYKHITCVTFFGGDADPDALNILINFVKDFGKKTAVYSGKVSNNILWNNNNLDYLKLGPYVPKLGPLTNRETNQKIYKRIDGYFVEITHFFHKTLTRL